MDQLRFQRAMQLMSDPAMKLEHVGYRCGFTSASVFSRAFKAKYGCSPQAWRPAESR
jgi:AraC-like DNA-binding protein